jgi:hypothetical protein
MTHCGHERRFLLRCTALTCYTRSLILGREETHDAKANRVGGRVGYRSGRSRDWVKMKNPAAPAVKRDGARTVHDSRTAISDRLEPTKGNGWCSNESKRS